MFTFPRHTARKAAPSVLFFCAHLTALKLLWLNFLLAPLFLPKVGLLPRQIES